MCGIVGISLLGKARIRPWNDLDKLRTCFGHMLVNAQVRGKGATGISLFSGPLEDKRPHAHVVKGPVPAEDFVKADAYLRTMKNLNNAAFSLMGHTRAPTGGSSSPRDNTNNHPHVQGTFVGVHNGKVDDHLVWKTVGEHKRKSRCDSEALFAMMAHQKLMYNSNAEKAIVRAVPRVRGFMAFAVQDLEEPTKVFLMKDKNTPMELYWCSRLGATFFASEKGMVEDAFKKTGIGYELESIPLSPFTLLCIDSSVGVKPEHAFSTTKLHVNIKDAEEYLKEHEQDYRVSQGG